MPPLYAVGVPSKICYQDKQHLLVHLHNLQEFDPVLKAVCDDFLGPLVFNTVDARAEELGGSATMLTEFGECSPSYDHPDYQGRYSWILS